MLFSSGPLEVLPWPVAAYTGIAVVICIIALGERKQISPPAIAVSLTIVAFSISGILNAKAEMIGGWIVLSFLNSAFVVFGVVRAIVWNDPSDRMVRGNAWHRRRLDAPTPSRVIPPRIDHEQRRQRNAENAGRISDEMARIAMQPDDNFRHG